MRSDAERLADILDAAKITAKVAEGREAFDEDEYVQLPLVHLVQIIGEAAARLSDEVTATHRQVDPETLWAAVSRDVPQLAEQIREIASSLESTNPTG